MEFRVLEGDPISGGVQVDKFTTRDSADVSGCGQKATLVSLVIVTMS